MKNEAVSLISTTARRLAKAIVIGSSAVAFFAVAAQTPDGGIDQDATERQGAEGASTLSTAFLKPDFSRRDPIVPTDKGRVRGYFSEAGVATFLGIPYAKPPVGNLRWRPPEAPSPWSNTLETKQFSPICAQITTLTVFAGPINYNEDCLYLNVFTPNTKPNRKLPVLVWIHGGGNFDGEANDYDPTKLVIQGNLVVVTFNYRLGLLGWLAHPALDSEGHQFGNYGLLDQQAVLRWVKSNVASFGGDPDNVTLGGQSAGSYDTSANMVSPLAKGLFHHAILQSLFGDSKPLASAREIGKQFATAAGCDSGASVEVANCLRNLPARTIMNIQGTPQDSGALTIINNISDGTIIPSEGVLAKIKNGEFSRVPVLSGMTHDEFNFGFVAVAEYWSKPRAPITTAQYTIGRGLRLVRKTEIRFLSSFH